MIRVSFPYAGHFSIDPTDEFCFSSDNYLLYFCWVFILFLGAHRFLQVVFWNVARLFVLVLRC